jgi:ferritin-like metal-binding protein YciE
MEKIMTEEIKKNTNEYQIKLLGEINKKFSNQRNEAHNRIAQLELVIESLQRENQNLKNSIEGNKIFKENKKDK